MNSSPFRDSQQTERDMCRAQPTNKPSTRPPVGHELSAEALKNVTINDNNTSMS